MIARTQGGQACDPRCRELAEHFLNDHPRLNTAENIDALARMIQIEIEDWITYEARHDIAARARALVCGVSR